MTSISEILYCPGVYVGYICFGQAWVLSRIFNQLQHYFGIETVYGLVSSSVFIDKVKYTLGCLYIVERNEYRIHSVFETNKCLAVTSKVVGSKHRDFDECLEELSIEPFSRDTSLLKRSFKCIDETSKKCVITTSSSKDYSLSYLVLSLKCRENSIEVKTMSILEELIDYIVNPINEFIASKCVEMKINKTKCSEIVENVNKHLLILMCDLINRNNILLTHGIDLNNVINYIKSVISK